MPADASEVVVGANGRVLVAPADTAVLPTTMAALNAVWVEVGYVSEDGVTFTDGKDIEDVNAWQAFYPIRKLVSAKNSAVEFVMRQWNESTVPFAFGGGTISRTAGVTTYKPPAPGVLDERALIVEWTDGAETFRLVFPRGMVTGEVSANVVRTAALDLPINYEVTPAGVPDGTLAKEPWYLLTNATQFVIT